MNSPMVLRLDEIDPQDMPSMEASKGFAEAYTVPPLPGIPSRKFFAEAQALPPLPSIPSRKFYRH